MSDCCPLATPDTWKKNYLTSPCATESDKLIEIITIKLSDGMVYPLRKMTSF